MMPGRLSKKGKLAVTWNRFYLQALDLDRWNNCGEALIFYEQYVHHFYIMLPNAVYPAKRIQLFPFIYLFSFPLSILT